MKFTKVLLLAASSTMLLAGCAKKVEFEDFQSQVMAINLEGVEVTGVKFSCKVGDVKDSVEYEGTPLEITGLILKDTTLGGVPVRVNYSTIFMISAKTLEFVELKNATYYAGSTFKVEYENDEGKVTQEFDKYGYCTRLLVKGENESSDVRATYRYSK